MELADLADAPWNPRETDEQSLATLRASRREFGDMMLAEVALEFPGMRQAWR